MIKRIMLLFCACLLFVSGSVATVTQAELAFGKEELKKGATEAMSMSCRDG